MGIPYYIVWDPALHLGEVALHCFTLNAKSYKETEPWCPRLELGVTTWQGVYQGMKETWLRWCDERGDLLLTAAEKAEGESRRAEAESRRAEAESRRAEAEIRRAQALADKLRALGVDPDKL